MKLLVAILLAAVSVGTGYARQRTQGWCEEGGQKIIVVTYHSSPTTPVQRSFPGCMVTVYVTGSTGPTLATLYQDSAGTIPLANPFQATTDTGFWFFYTDNGNVDIQFSGPGMTTFTLGDVLVCEQCAGGGVPGSNFPGKDWCEQVQNAVNALNGQGGTIFLDSRLKHLDQCAVTPVLTPNVQLNFTTSMTGTINSTLFLVPGDSVVGPWGGPSAGSTTLSGAIIHYGGPGAPTVTLSGGSPTTAAATAVIVSNGTYNSVAYSNSISAVDVYDGGKYAAAPTAALANVGAGSGATIGNPVMGLNDSFTISGGSTPTGDGLCGVLFDGGNGDAVGYVNVVTGVMNPTIHLTGRGTGYTSVPTTGVLSTPLVQAAGSCIGAVNLSGGSLAVVGIPVTARGSGYPYAAVISMHDCAHCSVQHMQLDGNIATGIIGISYESDNSPATDLGEITQVTIKNVHHGVSVGWDSIQNGRSMNFESCTGALSQLGCSQSDTLVMNQVQVYGFPSPFDFFSTGLHVNSANALQTAQITQFQFQLVNAGVDFVVSNGSANLFGVAGGSFVQEPGLSCSSTVRPPLQCSTTFRMRPTLAVSPSIANSETEGGQFAIVDYSESVSPSRTVWQSNSLNQRVVVAGNDHITSIGNYGGVVFHASGPTGISSPDAAPYTYAGGSSGCTPNSRQTVLFTVPDAMVQAQGFINIDGSGNPTGNVRVLNPGGDYVIPPTQGTITTCTGLATFTAGILSSYRAVVNSNNESNWVADTYLAATGCVSLKSDGVTTDCDITRTLKQFMAMGSPLSAPTNAQPGDIIAARSATSGVYHGGNDGNSFMSRADDGSWNISVAVRSPNMFITGPTAVAPTISTSGADGFNLGMNYVSTAIANDNWFFPLTNRSGLTGGLDAICVYKALGTAGCKQVWYDNGHIAMGGHADLGVTLGVTGGIRANGTNFAAAPTCNSSLTGTTWTVLNNSAAPAWGANADGAGSAAVLAWCNGSAWTVVGK